MRLRVDRALLKGAEPSISQTSFILKLGRTLFLTPFESRLAVLPVSVLGGGLTGLFSCCFLRDVSVNPILGKNGRVSVRIHNFSDRLTTLSPKLKVVRGTFSGSGRILNDPQLVLRLTSQDSPTSERPDVGLESSPSFSVWQSRFPYLFADNDSSYATSSTLRALVVRADDLIWKSPVPFADSGAPPCFTDCSAQHARHEIESLLSRGIIQEVPRFDRGFFSPVIFLRKPDGRVRVVVNFQKLNHYSEVWNSHTPDTRTAIRAVEPSWRFFTILDLRDGYFHIPVDTALSRLFCFSCFGRRFRFVTFPQGWASSVGFFNDRIRRILGHLPGLAYFDDIIVGGQDRVSHDRNLEAVLTALQSAGLHVNPRKVQFCCPSVQFLGFSLSGDQYHQRNFISQQLAQLPLVRSRKELQRVLGIFTACRGNCPGLGIALAPLYSLLHKQVHSIDWSEVQNLIRAVAARLIRNSLNFLRCVASPSFHLEVDWSGAGAGYLLYAGHRSQRRIIATNSRSLHGYPVSSFLGELDAIIWCLQDTLPLTVGCPVHLYTDSLSALQKLQARDVWYKSRSNLRVGRRLGWLWSNFPPHTRLFLHFLPSSDNFLADCLSRWPTLPQRKEVDLNVIQGGEYKGQGKRLQAAHEGHWGVKKTVLNLKRDGGPKWRRMERDVQEYVANCWTCQMWGQVQHRVDLGITTATGIGDAVGIDFAGPLPIKDREEPRYILVMVDYLSRWVEAWACTAPSSEVAVKALGKWRQKNGKIKMLVSDNAQTWRSKEVRSWCERNKTVQRLTASYMPQSNGMCERQIGVLKGRLKRMAKNPWEWRKVLPTATRIMNRSVNETTGYSAAELKNGEMRNGRKVKNEVQERWIQEAIEKTLKRQEYTNELRRKKFGSRKRVKLGDHVLRPRIKADAGTFRPPWDEEPCVVKEALGNSLWLVEGLLFGKVYKVHDDQLRQVPHMTTAQLEACRDRVLNDMDGD